MHNFIKPSDFHKLNQTLCRSLEADLGSGKQDIKTVVYGVSRGGDVPALHISHHFDIPLKFIEISSYDGESQKDLKVLNNLPGVKDLTGVERVIIADDIVDTGATMDYIVRYLLAIQQACYLEFEIITAALVVSTKKRAIPIEHFGTTNTSGWVVFPYEKSSED